MTNLFYSLYQLKGDDKERADLCEALIKAGHDPSKTFKNWSLIDQAIKNDDERLMIVLENAKINPIPFYETYNIDNYEEKEIERLYRMFGNEYYRNIKLSPICHLVHNCLGYCIGNLMENGGKSVRKLIIEDICSTVTKGVDSDILTEICEIDECLDAKYNIRQNIITKLCSMDIEAFRQSEDKSWLWEGMSYEDIRDERGYDLLMIACENDDLKTIGYDFKHLSPIRDNAKENCALYVACEHSSLEIVEELFNRFGKVRSRRDYVDKCFRIALKHNKADVVSYLMTTYHSYTRDRDDSPLVLEYSQEEYDRFVKNGAYFLIKNGGEAKLVEYKPGDK